MTDRQALQAVILAGGQGTRLHPLTLARAKPVVPLLNRPFLAYQLALLRAHVVDPVRARQDDVGDAVRPEQRELVSEERPVQEWNDGLRPRERERAQAGALAAGQDHRLQGLPVGHYLLGDHGSASLINITGMSSRIG